MFEKKVLSRIFGPRELPRTLHEEINACILQNNIIQDIKTMQMRRMGKIGIGIVYQECNGRKHFKELRLDERTD
jgi:hypothetical protein